jgi:hypothetical protein
MLKVRALPLEPILFDVSRLTMLKKDASIASEAVVESEWVDLQQDI